ncbi:MAG TPA: hypothetical protein PKL83_05165 [bacterium]|nr:hypothetical protein [bacterium]
MSQDDINCFNCKYSRVDRRYGPFYCEVKVTSQNDEQGTALLTAEGLDCTVSHGLVYMHINGDSLPWGNKLPCVILDSSGKGSFIDKGR